ncbi:AAA family ATPase [Rothia mucilaginosa]|uniref:AAA family ATPase n=1 Tax=Rothia mucilaginosa TaxID=43675 RepID=UPI0028DC5131|nr:AAA family ATPase [Rothia mucilaginosa]
MVDATKVSKIKIDTGYAGVKEYPIFTRMGKNDQVLSDAQCAIILGKNGSGKSTIARALSSENSDVKFFDKDGVFIGSDYSNVYVFDERFIGENFRMSDGEVLELIFEIRKLKSLQETISSIQETISSVGRVSLPDGSFDRILGPIRNSEKQWTPKLQGANQVIEGSDEPHENFEEPQISELSHKKEGFEDSAAKKESEGSVIGRISEDIHEDSTADDMSNRDEWQEAWDSLSPEEKENITRKISRTSQKIRQHIERFSVQIDEGFQMPRIVRDPRKAINNINALSAIVFGVDSISVKYKEGEGGEDGYEILKGNKKVVPSSLSTGEQNILSLCYFFAQMMDGEEHGSLKELLVENRIIVLDDPLSSFDFDNKYGVIRLLDHVMNLMSKNNSESKLIIMTHDPETAIELSKIAIGRLGGKKVKCCEISNNDEGSLLESVKFDGIDEYKNILGKMYGIAVGKEDTEMPAPNEVRRVWEAFLRFELGVSSVSDRKAIEKVRDYYNKDSKDSLKYEFLDSFMSYAFIHQDSHSASQMLFFNFSLFPVLSDEDFRKHIRQIICFIHIVSPLHIASRLSNDGTEAQKYREELENMYKQIVRKES